MEEVGIVTKVDGITAHVSVERKAACEHCTSGTCHLDAERAMIEALNEAGAVVGQQVRVSIRQYTYVTGTVFFYGVPAVALILGAVLGMEVLSGLLPGRDPEAVTAISAFVCLGLSLIVIKIWSWQAERKSAYQPFVQEILDHD